MLPLRQVSHHLSRYLLSFSWTFEGKDEKLIYTITAGIGRGIGIRYLGQVMTGLSLQGGCRPATYTEVSLKRVKIFLALLSCCFSFPFYFIRTTEFYFVHTGLPAFLQFSHWQKGRWTAKSDDRRVAWVVVVVVEYQSTPPTWLAPKQTVSKHKNRPGIPIADISYCYFGQYRRVALNASACQIFLFFLHLRRKFIAAVDLI